MKKILAILCAILIFSGLSVSCPAQVTGKPFEYLKNGGFEDLATDVKPSVWSLEPGFTWGEEATLVRTNPAEGNLALRLNVPESKDRAIQSAQPVSVNPGMELTLRFQVRSNKTAASRPFILFEYATGVPIYYVDGTDDWKAHEVTFTVPANVWSFNVRIIAPQGNDQVWDDFSLTRKVPANEAAITPYEGYVAPLDFYDQKPLEGAGNLITNSDFSEANADKTPKNWNGDIKNNSTGTVYMSVDNTVPGNEGDNCLKLELAEGRTSLTLEKRNILTTNHSGGSGEFKPNTRYRLSVRVYCNSLPQVAQDLPLIFRTTYYINNGTSTVNPIDDGQKSYNVGPTKVNTWEEHVAFFTAPENTTSIQVSLSFAANTGSVIWIDDVELRQVEEENYAELHPDQIFYYAEDGANKAYENKTGYARLRVFPEHVADCEDGYVNFKLTNTDKTQVLAEKTGVSLSEDHMALFTYPLSGMAISGYQAGDEEGQTPTEKPYLLIAEVYNKTGVLQDTVLRAIYKYRRPENMNLDGQMLDENGEIFTPTIADGPGAGAKDPDLSVLYGDTSPDKVYGADEIRVDEMQALGLNTLEFSTGFIANRYDANGDLVKDNANWLKKNLDAVAAKGMKAVVSFYHYGRHAAHPYNYYRTIATIEEFKDHPGVGIWCVMDEPWDMIMEQEYWLGEIYKLIRRYDDQHPIFFTDNSMYMEYSSLFSDMVSVDPYPSYPMYRPNLNTVEAPSTVGGEYTFENYFPDEPRYKHCTSNPGIYAGETTAILRRTTERYGKSIVQIHPAFSYNGYLPSLSDLRSFWYQTLFEGGHGSGWFHIYGQDSIYDISAGTGATLTTIDKVNGRVTYVEKEIEAKPWYWEWYRSFGKEEMALSNLLFGRTSPYPTFNRFESADYAYKCVAANGDLYALVWNKKAGQQTIEVSLKSQNGMVTASGTPIELYHPTNPDAPTDTTCRPQVQDGKLTVTLQSGAFGLIRIPCAVGNADRLSSSSFTDIGSLPSDTQAVIENVWRAGIMDAAGDRVFAPTQNMTRGAFTKALIRALDLECLSSRGALQAQFNDVDSSAPYAREVQVARSLNILRGTGSNCSPEAAITGAEAKILCERALAVALRTFDEYGSFGTGANVTRAEAAVLMQKLHAMQQGEV